MTHPFTPGKFLLIVAPPPTPQSLLTAKGTFSILLARGPLRSSLVTFSPSTDNAVISPSHLFLSLPAPPPPRRFTPIDVSPCILFSQILGLARVLDFKVITIVMHYSIGFLGSTTHILFESIFLNFFSRISKINHI